MNPWKAYIRWRHRRGFGVHSPFAYNLVNTAINPGKYGYYGYARIDRVILSSAFEGYPQLRKDARLVLRLLINLECVRLLLPEALPEPALKAMRAVSAGASAYTVVIRSGSNIKPHKKDLLFADGSIPYGDLHSPLPGHPADLSTRIEAGSAVMLVNPTPGQIEALYHACRHGVIFEGTRVIVAVPRKDMAFVSYPMQF